MFIAAQLVWPALNLDLPWTSFGRIRPIHTSLVIAFGGSALFATSFYVVQRTSGVRLISDALARFVFWGWQAAIVGMIVSYPLGYTTSKEYAEMEWPLALWMAIVCGLCLPVLRHHRPPQGEAHLRRQLVLRRLHHRHRDGPYREPCIAAGKPGQVLLGLFRRHRRDDPVVVRAQCGRLHPLGRLPRHDVLLRAQAGRATDLPYRLSIVHFWAIISIYIWAGPHHLHYTALPDWAQSLGMVMSLILLAPSWGGMINGMMTLSGAWHKLRDDPILRFLVVSLAFYGMSTFEGPMMAIKTVNSLSHYTDWTIGHVHAGALGWVAMISIGTLYHMIPKLWGRERMHSVGLINAHFWLATIGTVLYIASMWVNGITQGLMWRAINEDGTLTYSFVEALVASHPGYVVRLLGGATFASGMLLMAYNTWRTLRSAQEQRQPVLAASQGPEHAVVPAVPLHPGARPRTQPRRQYPRGTRAGRPAAVRRRSRGRPPVARDTGKICRQVVRPSRNPARPPARRSSPEPTPSSRDGCLQHVPCGAGNGPFRFEEFHERLPSTAVRTWLKGFRP